ncbi:MAG: hypothetical protein HQ543_03145 [Bacteroidetes bacterium]|nr:hypothetical protein [Bacteroidota bacterium]
MSKIKDRYVKNLKKRISNYTHSHFKRLNVEKFELGIGLWNLKCHVNSIQKVEEGKSSKVLLVVINSKSDYCSPIVHFINQNKGKYIDNTLGYEYKINEYYLVREIDSSEFDDIYYIFRSFKQFLFDMVSNKFLSWIFKVDKDII